MTDCIRDARSLEPQKRPEGGGMKKNKKLKIILPEILENKTIQLINELNEELKLLRGKYKLLESRINQLEEKEEKND